MNDCVNDGNICRLNIVVVQFSLFVAQELGCHDAFNDDKDETALKIAKAKPHPTQGHEKKIKR